MLSGCSSILASQSDYDQPCSVFCCLIMSLQVSCSVFFGSLMLLGRGVLVPFLVDLCMVGTFSRFGRSLNFHSVLHINHHDCIF